MAAALPSLPSRTTTATGRTIPMAGVRMNLRNGITTARRTGIAAILHREPIRHRAAAIRRRLVPTLRRAAATAVAEAPVAMVEAGEARTAAAAVVVRRTVAVAAVEARMAVVGEVPTAAVANRTNPSHF
jgi:hypothetical protein